LYKEYFESRNYGSSSYSQSKDHRNDSNSSNYSNSSNNRNNSRNNNSSNSSNNNNSRSFNPTLSECYKILGLDINDDPSFKEIKKAYFKQARIYHPDKCTNINNKKQNEKQMQKINIAYEKLDNYLNHK